MSYFGREVFQFEITHSDPWSGDLYAQKELVEVAGVSVTQGIGAYAARRLTVRAVADDIVDVEAFDDYSLGRARGFWLPLVNASMSVVAGIDGSTFICKGRDLAERWGRDPDQHILLTAPSGAAYPRRVADVVVYGQNSLVTLDVAEDEEEDYFADRQPLPVVISSDWACSLLIYCRRTDDDLTVETFGGEVEFSISVTELPFEYNDADAPRAAIYLYQLGYEVAGNESWTYLTNWRTSVLDDGFAWVSAPIRHDDINEDLDGASTTINSLAWPGSPLLDQFPKTTDLPLLLKIYATEWDFEARAETGERVLLFDGMVRKPRLQGEEITAKCTDGADLYARNVPVIVKSRNCGATFCDARCGLNRQDFVVSAVVIGQTEIDRYYIDVELTESVPSLTWLSLGHIGSFAYYSGQPSKLWEWRPIQGIVDLGDGQLRLQIREGFKFLEPADGCYLFAGCAQTPAVCKAKVRKDGSTVDNYINYQAEPDTPIRDPKSVSGTYATESGSKK